MSATDLPVSAPAASAMAAAPRARAPFTRWEDVPLVCGIEDTARVLNRSRRAIERDLSSGRMVPQPMPRLTRRAPLQWSRSVLREFVDGGYRKFETRPGGRQYFAKAGRRPSATSR